MKIPHRIRIKRNVFYEIVFAEVVKNDYSCMGYCDGDNKQIILKIEQSKESMIKTLIHELIHAIEFTYKTPIPHKITEMLENGIYAFLKLNKWI